MRNLFILLVLLIASTAFSQSFKLDKIRNPFDRSLRDYLVVSDNGGELFYLKAESYKRSEFADGAWQSKQIKYYRIIFPNQYREAEVPYVSRHKLKRFIRQQRLIEDDELNIAAATKVIRLYQAYFSQERIASLGVKQGSRPLYP